MEKSIPAWEVRAHKFLSTRERRSAARLWSVWQITFRALADGTIEVQESERGRGMDNFMLFPRRMNRHDIPDFAFAVRRTPLRSDRPIGA